MHIPIDCRIPEEDIKLAISAFSHHLNVNRLIEQMRSRLTSFAEQLMISAIEKILHDGEFMKGLKALAGRFALRFNGFKPTSVRLLSGRKHSIDSPYFYRAAPKAGRKGKKRKAKSGCHMGLAHLGFIDRCGAVLASSAVRAAVLCPSFEIAGETLRSLGVEMGVKTIKRLCRNMGERALENRHRMMISDADALKGRTLMVCIDGGRLRERRPKRGRRAKGAKRQGYHTDWREPTQIVIQWLDDDGRKRKDIAPIYDATMGDTDAAFDLLAKHLRNLECQKADRVAFCADGARKYWTRFRKLARELDLKATVEIIDYTHAKQNLEQILDKLPGNMSADKRKAIGEHWKNLIWRGDIAELGAQIRLHVRSGRKLEQALNKYNKYFKENSRRMQYSSFKLQGLPTGSGCVESAIRRVINLRLKSPGIFWKLENAEIMLFLRSALLCGRWEIMLKNLLAINRGGLIECH